MTAVKILTQHWVDAEVEVLASAWSAPPTFALIPDKIGSGSDLVAPWLETLTPMFQAGHFMLLTSGSTGTPKLIVGKRERAEALVRVLHRLQDLEALEETLVTLPLTYSYAFVNQWLWSRVFRRRLVLTRGLAEPDHLRERLASASQAMLCLVGAQVPLLLQHFCHESFPGVIRLNFAGGRFPQEQLPALARLFPKAQVFNNYGCAEALPRLTVRKAEDADEARILGFPIDGVELSTDTDSNLLFRSPYGAVGIVEDGAFHPVADGDWIATGDLGERRADGRWQLLGRASEVFKRYGEKLSLAAIAATVNSAWPGQCGFYREADPSGEEGYVLVLAPMADAASLRAVLHAFRAGHTRPHWPLRIEAVAAMPL
ncbi:MAG TPA: class I adenylate-forming enzyme family protein, partial [Ktedonobacterales bacterium]|nr:class I adenylate-forming enzyme family protein [Ktedonobacterales bacterium]